MKVKTRYVYITPGMAQSYALVLGQAIQRLGSADKFLVAQLRSLKHELESDEQTVECAAAPAPLPTDRLEESERVERLIDACEGELDGLAVDHATACRIMFYVDNGRLPEESIPAAPSAAAQSTKGDSDEGREWSTMDTNDAAEAMGIQKLPKPITWTELHRFAEEVARRAAGTDGGSGNA